MCQDLDSARFRKMLQDDQFLTPKVLGPQVFEGGDPLSTAPQVGLLDPKNIPKYPVNTPKRPPGGTGINRPPGGPILPPVGTAGNPLGRPMGNPLGRPVGGPIIPTTDGPHGLPTRLLEPPAKTDWHYGPPEVPTWLYGPMAGLFGAPQRPEGLPLSYGWFPESKTWGPQPGSK